ncbi:hypothetical protein COS18_04845 [Candidatus Falkowbacteria bacterium CG02_land_8_20_14_3_00_36_14]|uniref:Uncharacterized protein n=1 Tax=Candidatus Falkowbacteria bacterium CG02_land_8_20_14_3_00_36_14 TaxID=1974560 RepID=A0A2M7DL49_9BACT|nr:MAG: hypothetical protein COS18_04845 [Candidatus Falkowbacteria bacterium CG02_land_8_20_14_3_00_36_14]
MKITIYTEKSDDEPMLAIHRFAEAKTREEVQTQLDTYGRGGKAFFHDELPTHNRVASILETLSCKFEDADTEVKAILKIFFELGVKYRDSQ